MLEEKYGQSRRSYKIWPNDLPEAKEVPKDHLGYKKYGENDKKKDEESKTGTSAGTGFFISNKGHIVTNFHVIQIHADYCVCPKKMSFHFEFI